MDVSLPLSVLAPGVRGKVLTALARATEQLSGREVARRAGVSQRGAALVLHDLEAHGLVRAHETRSAVYYWLVREHIAADLVLALADLPATLRSFVRERVAGWATPPLSVVLFGSTARGDGDVDSDIDLLVIRPPHINEDDDDDQWWADASDLFIGLYQLTGNPTSMFDWTPAKLQACRPEFVENVLHDSILLWGRPLHELLSQAQENVA
ncbi:MAG: nucleotidyltransferase domain-containing protein [Egibacteraceae bacterium]